MFTIKQKNNLVLLIPFLLIAGIVLLAKSSLFQLHPEELSIGITFDLVLVVPLIHFLLIRKRDIPKITVVPFFILGLVIASFIIPPDFQFYLSQFKLWLLPVVETTVFFIIVFKVRQLRKTYKKDRSITPDFYTAMKNAADEVLPKKVSHLLATEIGVIHYGFFQWKKKTLKSNEYSYHKDTGSVGLLAVLIFVVLIETAVVHLVLEGWSPIVAWILSILSMYTALQIFGMLRSLNKRPIVIEENQLLLRYGMFNEVGIPFDEIESIVLDSKDIELNKHTRKLSPLGELEPHNVVIKVKNETTMYGLYGLKKTFTTLALHVDEKERFVNEVQDRI